MAWFLFIDESGQDHRDSPYEALAGVAVRDEVLWHLVQELHDAELARFGARYTAGKREIKAKKLLKRKVFQHARLNCEVLPHEVPELAHAALADGAANGSIRHLKALALAKLGYVSDVFSICKSEQCRVFASIVEVDAPKSEAGGLRKDYAYLFERFFYFLEDHAENTGRREHGVIVFDELEKSQSHILIDQAHRYFKETATGRLRATLIIPEPFFVHSDLTTGVQIADLVAYTVSWAFRTAQMYKGARTELDPYARQIAAMRYRAVRERHGNPNFEIWSIAHIRDLRTSSERTDDE